MRKKVWIISAVVVMMLLITGTTAAFTQTTDQAILGTVYNDLDANGVCVGTGEPGLASITVGFANTEAAVQTGLQTNQDGTYGYNGAAYGNWSVTVQPPDGWRSTNQQTQQVTLSSTQPVVSGVDFCITQSTSSGAPAGGAILGTVYNDLDANGVCVGTGEPGLPGMVVEFVNSAAAIQTALKTNENGSYGYTAAGFGAWNVTVKPPAGWRSTAEQTRQVTLSSTQPVAAGLDFCITQGTTSGGSGETGGGDTGNGGAVTLPDSGAPIAPALLIAALVGIGLLAIGAGIYFYSRRASA